MLSHQQRLVGCKSTVQKRGRERRERVVGVISVTFEAFWGNTSPPAAGQLARFASIKPFLASMPSSVAAHLVRLCCCCLLGAAVFSSCVAPRYYRQRVMFQVTDEKGHLIDTVKFKTAVNRAAKNYLLQPNDYLEVRVFTNKGEKILDPNGELHFGGNAGGASVGKAGATGGAGGGSAFLVQADGTVVLPLVNRVKVAGLSLIQADSILRKSYNEYYKDPFVTTSVSNNRVIVLGAAGGQVVPLNNDNMNLLEVLALVGGGSGSASTASRYGGRFDNIRVIRGDLKNPQIQQINLTTLNGMRQANLQVEPNDVIYVEPVRRPVQEALADIAPVYSLVSLLLTTSVLVVTLLRR